MKVKVYKMKKLILTIFFSLVLSLSAEAKSKCLDILNSYVPSDSMIKLAHLTDNSLKIYINNIRNMKDIDIKKYGFNKSMSKEFEDNYDCPKTSFIKSYNEYGIPNSIKIKGKLLKDYKNQVIVLKD